MKPLTYILPVVLLASCADKVPPRAIILPPTVIESVDSQPVEKAAAQVEEASRKVTDANRKAAQANDKAISTSASLKEAMERLRIVAEGNKILTDAWQDAERFAANLGEDLILTRRALSESDTESNLLREAVKAMSTEISTLKASAAVNKAATDTLRAENKTLRAQAEEGNAARDQLIDLKATSKEQADTLKGWIRRLAITTACFALTSALLGYLLLKP